MYLVAVATKNCLIKINLELPKIIIISFDHLQTLY